MKTLIEMAREAGFVEYKCDYCQIVEPVKQMIAAAVAREREACAKVCEEVGVWPSLGPKHCAEAIRARGNT